MLCKFACVSCGREVFREIEDDAVDYMYDVYASYIKCSPCMEAADREWGERQEAERRRREAAANAELAERRLKASGLLKYELVYDPGDKRGNPELFSYVSMHRDSSLWIAGRTGLCKSRILQYWGREAVKTRSVQYWPTMDLLAYLSENSKNITRILEEIYRVELLILDDGFQYLRLKAHINIILVDSTSPFDNHHVLPRGLMREPIEHILRADYVFLTKSDGSPRLRHLKEFIRKHNHRAEIIECCHKPKYLEEVFDRGRRHPLESLQGKKIASISAIANPASFEGFLEDLGGELVLKRHYADHHRYRQQEMIDFINDAKAAGAELIVTTEKDAVRMPRLDRRDIQVFFLRVEIDILSGQESFDQCISRICFI